MFKRLLAVSCLLLFVALPTSSRAALPLAATGVAYKAQYFEAESQAQQHFPHDGVVWLNANSGIYHYKGERWYARTRRGAFVCEKEAIAEGDRATRNGQ